MATTTSVNGNLKLKGVRFAFANVYKPTAYKETDTPKYNVTILIPKNDPQVAEIEKIIAALEAELASKKWKNGKKPKDFESPLRDGDDKDDYTGFAGCYYIAAKSKTKPGVINKAKQPITEESGDFYSGCIGSVTINLYPYSDGGGIAAGLNNILKTADGERFAGKRDAEDDFADDIEEEDDDLLGS
jgi:hypothetical protein